MPSHPYLAGANLGSPCRAAWPGSRGQGTVEEEATDPTPFPGLILPSYALPHPGMPPPHLQRLYPTTLPHICTTWCTRSYASQRRIPNWCCWAGTGLHATLRPSSLVYEQEHLSFTVHLLACSRCRDRLTLWTNSRSRCFETVFEVIQYKDTSAPATLIFMRSEVLVGC